MCIDLYTYIYNLFITCSTTVSVCLVGCLSCTGGLRELFHMLVAMLLVADPLVPWPTCSALVFFGACRVWW